MTFEQNWTRLEVAIIEYAQASEHKPIGLKAALRDLLTEEDGDGK